MPSTGKNNGTLLALYKGGTKVTHCTSTSMDISLETIDVTTKDSSGWRDILPGVRSWSGSGEFIFAEDASVGLHAFFTDVSGRSPFTAMWSTAVSGDKIYSGTAYVTSISQTGGVEDAQTYSISLEGKGAIASGTSA